MSWWNSIEILQSLSFHAAWIAALTGFIAAVTAGFSWIASTRVDTLEGQNSAITSQADANERATIKADIAKAKKLIPETTGLLSPGNGPIPANPIIMTHAQLREESLSRVPPEQRDQRAKRFDENMANVPDLQESSVRIYFGSSATWTNEFPYTVIAQGNEDMVMLERIGDKIAFSAKFFDQDGKIVCEIVKNQFHVNPHKMFRMEKTDHRLRVFNDEARRVIDVEYINPTAIRLLGDFYMREGRHVVIDEKGTSFSKNVGGGSMVFTPAIGDRPIGLWIAPPAVMDRPFSIALDASGYERILLVGAPKLSEPAAGKTLHVEVPVVNKDFRQGIDIENHKVSVILAEEGVPLSRAIEIFEKAPIEENKCTLAQGESMLLRYHFDDLIDQRALDAINNKTSFILIFVNIPYRLGPKNHRTWYCAIYDAKSKGILPVNDYSGSE